MLMMDDVRAMLRGLCTERGESLAALSRLVGKNEAYLQQFLTKGTPRRLPEDVRRTLSRYFAVPDSMLGGPEADPALDPNGLVAVPRSSARVSAGPGALNEAERFRPAFAFDPAWLRQLTSSPAQRLSVVRVGGDSMEPTLHADDDLLVDHDDSAGRLRDGIYVLRVEGALLVKRLAIHPFGRSVTVQSDNPAYPDWPDRSLEEFDIIGRVIWAGRRLA